MGDLTTNFSRGEFQCQCDRPHQPVVVRPQLARGLQTLRDWVGGEVRIISGWRCPLHNAEEQGARNSEHLVFPVSAADLWADYPFHKLVILAMSVPQFAAGGVGVYPGSKTVHVDVRGDVARWARLKGRYVPITEGLEVLA